VIALAAIVGAVVSILKPCDWMAAATFPASSVQESELTFTASPSPLVVFDWIRSPLTFGYALRQALSSPESGSLALNLLTTEVLYQPAAFPGVIVPRSWIVGAVLSILIGPKLAPAAELPALSVHVPLELTVVPLVLVSAVTSVLPLAVSVALPLPPLSVQAKVTRTLWFVHASAT
jgi:hypothetical protein